MKDVELSLYVQTMDRRSNKILARLIKYCDEHFGQGYKLHLVDLSKSTGQASPLAVPALVREFPLPKRQAVGDFTDINRIMLTLNLLIQ